MRSILALVFAFACASAFSEEPITNARSALELPADKADAGLPIRIRGVVTSSDAKAGLSFVQDETAGIYFYGAAPLPKFGNFVEISGVTGKGLFSPIIMVEGVKNFGQTNLPSPQILAVEQLGSGRYDSQWVEVEGIVLRQFEHWGQLVLILGSGNSRMEVRVLNDDPSQIANLVDARVKIRGVAGTAYNDRRQLTGFHLLTQNTKLITVLEPPPADPFSAQLRSSGNMMSYSRRGASEHRTHLRGVVTFYWPGQDFFIRDESGGVRIQSRQTNSLTPGDIIDVVGFQSAGVARPILFEAIYRRVEKGAEPRPKFIAAKDVTAEKHEGELVTVEAKVLQAAERHAGYMALVLSAGDKVFRANYRDDWKIADDGLSGSVVRIKGVCAHDLNQQGAGEGFSIWMRRPEDFSIVARPPAWRQRQMLWAIGGAGGAVLLGAGWVILLRRRVQQQTAAIRKREATLEERYRDLFENSNDIVYTHDLQGTFKSMNNSGQAILGYTTEELSRMNVSDIIDPADLAKAHEQIERKLKGETARTIDELRVRSKSGQRLTFEVNSRLIMKDGEPAGFQSIARDITERKRAEEALQQSERQLRASLEERERLARDLHDSLIQSIYAVGLNIEDCSHAVGADPSAVEGRLRQAVASLNEVIREVRDYIMGLERRRINGSEFKAALKALALSAGESQSARIDISVDDSAAAELTPDEATQLLHIGREALTNAIRHSQAQKILLQLRRSPRGIVFEIADDGGGFNVNSAERSGHGLRNISSRAQEIHAAFQIIAREGEGTRIVLDISRQPEEQFASENPPAHR